ncbi:phosphoribosyl pyrophosphate synthase-associated protein 2 [Brevipalpus obovatus]|uniref:phosphoribosyl pyrophosphate synthase-associated protein 2 n=1 Tax=Brevipalpus obovatus TaxID=246614 RepID=UPI003D9EE048
MSRTTPDFVLLSGNSHPDFSQKIASRLNTRLGNCSIYHTSNRESLVDIAESVRGRDVFIIQTGTKDVNNNMMEALIMAYACKTSSANKIVGVIPYLPYSKQCRMRKRGCIVSKLLAKMMCRAGFTQIITIDLHSKEVQGFFDVPVDNLRASPFLLQYIQESIIDYKNAVIVAKEPGTAKKATSFAQLLGLAIAVLHGQKPKTGDSDEVDGRCSPPASESSSITAIDIGLDLIPPLPVVEKPPITLVGDVNGRVAIMVDDMIDDVRQFVSAAEVLQEKGAKKIYVLATHGLLSSDAPHLIENSPIDEVVVTNTVPHEVQKMQCPKIKTIDISALLAEAIRRIHNKESMSYLFRNVALED